MAYETGYAANEFDLQEKLNAFILSIGGWRKISQPSKFESVYYSAGEDGYKDIYVKTIAGMREFPYYYHLNQRDFGDGYVGYMNMFAYQYYPTNGDGYDGYGEAGRLGPFLYMLAANSNSMYSQRISSQSSSNRKWDYINGTFTLPDGEVFHSNYGPSVDANFSTRFDGKRYVYFMSTGSSGFFRFDLSIERCRILDTWWEWINGNGNWGSANLYMDPVTRREYMFIMNTMYGSYSSVTYPNVAVLSTNVTRYDLGDLLLETGFSGTLWRNVSGGSTYDFVSKLGDQVWDGHNYIYKTRGWSDSGAKGDWMKYDIKNDTWTDFSVSYPIPQIETSSTYLSNLIWLDKATSGLANHRLYYTNGSGGSTNIYYIDINENTGNPAGAWTSAGAAPGTGNYKKLFHNQKNRWFFTNRKESSGYDTLEFYYAPMSSGTLSWTTESTSYGPSTGSTLTNYGIFYSNNSASRVKVHLNRPTHYWFFGSKDHITVVTYAGGDLAESTNDYSFCYAGALDPFSSTTPLATVTSTVYPGSSVVIPIRKYKGEFYVGQKITIANVVDGYGAGQTVTNSLENIPRKFMNCETFIVAAVNPGVSITATTLNGTYVPGAKISYDPQPVGITLNGLDRIQMLNSVNSINTLGSFDMAENICTLSSVRAELINSSGNDSRFGGYVLWPAIAGHFGNDSSFSGSEARGMLRGVFFVSGTAGLKDRDTIVAGNNTYIVLSVETGQTYKYIFGPIS